MKYAMLCILLMHTVQAGVYNRNIQVGAEQTNRYFPLLKNKRIAILTNHTARIGNDHLVDVLVKNGFNIKKIFTPEHGFRGTADAGEWLKNDVDAKTNIPLISLHNAKKKPTTQDLQDIDILIFDIQDVGVRFYTYISSLQYFMEAAADNNKPLIILDRPNPNGFYIDGPVCKKECRSFVGMQQVPIVYGMTVGEYALMLNGEHWINAPRACKMTVIPCSNYKHRDLYELPIAPSPNLKTMQAVYLYPSLALFEGTPISIGRGTSKPFELFGHPSFNKKGYVFKPKAMPGAQKPSCINQQCYGFNLHDTPANILKQLNRKLNLSWLKRSYDLLPEKKYFFDKLFTRLAGTSDLEKQIKAGCTEEEIRKSWQPELDEFKKVRKKYLIYND
jgi:uncharacterized protein YbbC (DUF1343 family)